MQLLKGANISAINLGSMLTAAEYWCNFIVVIVVTVVETSMRLNGTIDAIILGQQNPPKKPGHHTEKNTPTAQIINQVLAEFAFKVKFPKVFA